MSLTNPKLFGLNVLTLFADVQNKNLALQNINLPPLDLEVILGSSNAGASRDDWISFSRLKQPLYKILDRYQKDSGTYGGLLLERAGTDGLLFGNLKINGSLSGNAIRYRYIKTFGASGTTGIADISTSRISAWSSSDTAKTTSTNTDIQGQAKISYGARLGIISGGSLIFGTQVTGETGVSNKPRLQTSITPQLKEFPSEFPTHKIQVSVGGQNVTLYTMKGIPVVFKGFFRNLNADIKLTQLINNTPASWKIVETGNANKYSNYTNQGDTTSSIRYRSSISRERFIQFYYNPDNILDISITSANISELPAVKFQNATRIELSYNKLRNFPDFNFITPNLEKILLRRNPFYLSETESERKLQSTESPYTATLTLTDGTLKTSTVLDKIPTGVRELYLEGTFYGSITQNIFADRFQQLTVFNVSRGGGAYFHPDTADSTNVLPNVSNTVETYSVQSNDFRKIEPVPPSGTANGTTRRNINQLENLISLNLSSNYYLTTTGSTFLIANNNNVIKNINISATGLPFPLGTEGKQSLETFSATYTRNLGKIVDLEGTGTTQYKFDNCGSLRTLALYAARMDGSRFPVFTNPNLTYIDIRYTRIVGGSPSGDETFVIPKATFEQAPALRNLYIDSSNLLSNKPIHPDAFVNNPDLYYIIYRSHGRTNGNLPSFSSNPNLQYLVMYQNAFTGSLPNLAANQNIYYVSLTNNKFTGPIPSYRNLSKLRFLYIQENNLTGIGDFENLPTLQNFYAQNNNISGAIPDYSECPNLTNLVLFNNNFTNYTSGSLKENYKIRYIDLSDNPLSSQAYQQLLDDLYENWKSVNRGGVRVNLRGCGNPNADAQDFITILRAKGWSITID